jgi:[ribosomal protein S18]-alanine N-acetyltransferase
MVRDRDNPDRSDSSPRPLILDRLTPRDLDDVADIERVCFHQPWSRESFRTILTDKTFEHLAARGRNRALAGYSVYSTVADELHILNVAVRPAFRRMGVGTALMKRMHDDAYRNGQRYGYLEVRESNRAAQRLYGKFGYRPLTKRLNYYSDNREDAILMGTVLERCR